MVDWRRYQWETVRDHWERSSSVPSSHHRSQGEARPGYWDISGPGLTCEGACLPPPGSRGVLTSLNNNIRPGATATLTNLCITNCVQNDQWRITFKEGWPIQENWFSTRLEGVNAIKYINLNIIIKQIILKSSSLHLNIMKSHINSVALKSQQQCHLS